MEAARLIFDRFRLGGENEMRRLEIEPEVETSFLDFKLTESPMRREDRENLGVAISGFANADGGVIVWGVDCRRDPQTGEDVVQGLHPVQGLKRLVSDMNEHTSRVVKPGVTGVEHIHLPCEGSADSGYVVTYVPRSDGGPHMAVASADQYRYYCRIGSSFLKMEHYMIADRFQRRPQAALEMCCEITTSRPIVGEKKVNTGEVLVAVGVRNTGRGIAMYPALAISVKPGVRVIPLFRSEDSVFVRRRTGKPGVDEKRLFLGGPNEVVYPGTEVWLTHLAVQTGELGAACGDVIIDHELHCDGFGYSGGLALPGNRLAHTRDQIWAAK